MQVRIFGREPAVWVYAINALVAAFVAYGLPLTQVQTAAISTLATAVMAVIVAVLTRPFVVSALTGAISTGLTAMAGFGLELSQEQIGATVAALNIVLALVLRMNVSPAPATSDYPPGAHTGRNLSGL
ncbi:hypothetical protein FXF51_56700 [Nonomuraea sp. PA05]|uniref:hypothetical protein n=1 Tax=Nonomuraea sp. PA05 TaxID=2604466 RepID=UPI0011D91106|nr:hypothetical protein [Nonomuraea sp. PA05]TYB50222.1 hypothetical protein FXF51_56700 [Nonomuraea sp. PA05]